MNRILSLCLLFAVSGCASLPPHAPANPRAFDFERDSLGYSNELAWEYKNDPVTGQITTFKRDQRPEFTQRCFTVSRTARQFFQYAQFDPAQPKADEAAYVSAISAVMSREPDDARDSGRVVIPGYADLRSFSREHEALFKAASGGPLSSYFQFSNWRMIFPFSRNHQQETAQKLLAAVKVNRLPLVHLIRWATFPVTEVDHFVMITAAVETEQGIQFSVFEPNDTNRPSQLIFDRATRTFTFPRNNYFAGGTLNVYEVNDDEHF